MEDKPLNKAHQQHRRADAFLRNKRFDDAIQCHQNAAELLLDAMKFTTSSRALESITLQHGYHLKQKDLIKARKLQYDRVKKAMDHMKNLSKDPFSETNQVDCKVQIEIYHTIQEADSLLQILCKPIDQSVFGSNEENVVVAIDALTELNTSTIKKKSKDRETFMEEFKTINQSIHTLVDKLVMQTELVKDENSILKDRIEYLEAERRKYLTYNLLNANEQRNYGIVSDINYSPEENSDFSFPPSEFRAESAEGYSVNNTSVDRPNFDLSALKDD